MSTPVTLRPVAAGDLPMLERLGTDPDLSGPLAWYGFRSAAALRRRFDEDAWLGPDDGRLMIAAGEDTVGHVSWHAVDYGPPPASRCWNIGIGILPKWRRRGYGAAAQRKLADYLFDTTTAERVEASTDVENIAEQRALEAAGFTREGVARRSQFRGGAWHDMVVYSRLRGE